MHNRKIAGAIPLSRTSSLKNLPKEQILNHLTLALYCKELNKAARIRVLHSSLRNVIELQKAASNVSLVPLIHYAYYETPIELGSKTELNTVEKYDLYSRL